MLVRHQVPCQNKVLMSSGSFLNQTFPAAQFLIRHRAGRSGSQVIVLLWKGVRMGHHTFQEKKLVINTWKDQGRRVLTCQLARWHGNPLGYTQLYNPGKNILRKMQKWPEFLSKDDQCSYMKETEKHLKLNTHLVHCMSTVQRHGAQQIKHKNKSKQPFSSSSSKTRGQKTMLNRLRLLHQQTVSESYKICVSG